MHEKLKIYVLNACLSKIHVYVNYDFFGRKQKCTNKEFFLQ